MFYPPVDGSPRPLAKGAIAHNGWVMMFRAPDRPRILAVLGPTNTGKTHYAVERMLAHESGVMGFPLRLLAREIYDRILAVKGPRQVALVTGEERLGPVDAPYVVATVEAMPLWRRFAFLAVDEIQLCADWERGHVFTDRLLHARGGQETVFLGSDTIRPLLRRLVPEAVIETRPRLSTLTYTGPARLDRLPRKSAIVAFTARDVYLLAEVMRRRKGGAAVVLGALSPRTRNAQVAMYQAGEVDYLVATDAIGMGLNMDLAHVAFAQLGKFDGRNPRRLTPAELAQIAGRAGRHMADGTFGVTNGIGEPEARVIEAVESHSFAPLRALRWRNSALDFSSLRALARSLDRAPPHAGLMRVRDALDHRSLALLSARPEIRARADRPERVRLLWEVCQIPDFRKLLTDAHLQLLATVFDYLTGPQQILPNDWVGRMISRLEQTDGDIDALVARIAHIRTWTYLSHRSDWLSDPRHWQERARAVEDRLSDALHERLTQRFVDRRTTALLRQLRERGEVEARIEENGEVLVDGHSAGVIRGLRYTPAVVAADLERRVVARAARKAVTAELAGRLQRIAEAAATEILLEGRTLLWQGQPIARLAAGPEILQPKVELLHGPELCSRALARARDRLAAWLAERIEDVLGPLLALRREAASDRLGGPARGLAWQLAEGLGCLPLARAEELLRALGAEDRARLGRLGVRFGRLQLYVAPALKPQGLAWRARLLSLWHDTELAAPPPGRTVLRDVGALAPALLTALGFVPFGDFALRVDVAERLAAALRRRARAQESFALPLDLAASGGLTRSELERLLKQLGFRRCPGEEIRYRQPPRRRGGRRRASEPRSRAGSPFEVLGKLRAAP